MTDGAWFPESMQVVDSHTEGEPTRVVVSGWPQPEGATMLERRETLRRRFDHLRRAGTTRWSARSSRPPFRPVRRRE